MLTDYSINSKVWSLNVQERKLEGGHIQMAQAPSGSFKILIVFCNQVIDLDNCNNLENFFSCKTEATLKLIQLLDEDINTTLDKRNDLISSLEELSEFQDNEQFTEEIQTYNLKLVDSLEKNSESLLQDQAIKYLFSEYPQYSHLLHIHRQCPNYKEAGLPDIWLNLSLNDFSGFYVEFKSPNFKTKKFQNLSALQASKIKSLESEGAYVCIITDFEDFKTKLNGYIHGFNY